MKVPADVRAEVEQAISAGGGDATVTLDVPLSGGCISPAARIEGGAGQRWFLKWAGAGEVPPDFFTSQAEGLRSLAAVASVRVPEVIAVAERWLLLEWLDPGSVSVATWSGLGTDLAQLHRCRGTAFGWPSDNYIGSLPQPNGARARWPRFWADRRIGPQWSRARESGFFEAADERAFTRLLARLDDILAPGDAEGASLLHGDLWSGNVHIMADGRAALIDPATYHGHREVDLAMAELFGGFDAEFFDAYGAAWPLQPGYHEERRGVYQLYYLLVHVNLFGSGYAGGVRRVLRRFGG